MLKAIKRQEDFHREEIYIYNQDTNLFHSEKNGEMTYGFEELVNDHSFTVCVLGEKNKDANLRRVFLNQNDKTKSER